MCITNCVLYVLKLENRKQKYTHSNPQNDQNEAQSRSDSARKGSSMALESLWSSDIGARSPTKDQECHQVSTDIEDVKYADGTRGEEREGADGNRRRRTAGVISWKHGFPATYHTERCVST